MVVIASIFIIILIFFLLIEYFAPSGYEDEDGFHYGDKK